MGENKQLYAALVECQKQIVTVSKDKRAVYGSYASFDSIINIVKPVLNDHGLFLAQKATTTTEEASAAAAAGDGAGLCIAVETIIYNSAGESLSSGVLYMPVLAERGKSLAQVCGSIITYAKRYSLCALLGIATGDDTDGAQTQHNGQRQGGTTLPPGLMEQAQATASNGQFWQFFKSLPGNLQQLMATTQLYAQQQQANYK